MWWEGGREGAHGWGVWVEQLISGVCPVGTDAARGEPLSFNPRAIGVLGVGKKGRGKAEGAGGSSFVCG